jgi:DNA modification methylase/ParB-like chromosome segregation protein Spo0J
MNLLSIETVIVPDNRIRKDFDEDKLEELADNIQEIGLIHLPVLRNGSTLVSGERRLRAIRIIYKRGETISYLGETVPGGMLPYASYEELSEEDAREIELYENIRRENLPWQLGLTALAELHKLKQTQDPTWTGADTAQAVGYESHTRTTAQIREKLVLADNLHRPEVRAAKSEREATAALRKSLTREFEDELRKRQGTKESRHTLLHTNAREWMPQQDFGSFDLILTDPPYGINADTFGYAATHNLARHEYDDSLAGALETYQDLAIFGYNLCKEQAHLYTFCAFETWHKIAAMFKLVGWDVWPRPIIWYKHRGAIPKPDLGPQYVHEYILFANKGNKPTTGLYPDVIDCPAVMVKKHAAEKPVDVYVDLLRRSAIPGDRVLDPFCGSGPIFPAAQRLGLIATGIDNNEEAIALSRERLNAQG